MQLEALNKKEIHSGLVVVYRGKTQPDAHQQHGNQPKYFYKLALIVSISSDSIVLSPFTAVWDDDDEPPAAATGPQRIPKSIPTPELTSTLARPVWTAGDALIHRGRPARITETKSNDMHVSIQYEDSAAGQFYGNLIWMDLSPTLNNLNEGPAWPSVG